MDTALLLGEGQRCGRLVFARPIAAVAVPITAATVAASPAVLVAFALRARRLAFRCRAVELELTGWRCGRLRRTRLLSRLLLGVALRLRATLGARPTVRPALPALPLAIALRPLFVTPLL